MNRSEGPKKVGPPQKNSLDLHKVSSLFFIEKTPKVYSSLPKGPLLLLNVLLLPYPDTDTEVCQSNQEHDHVDDQKRVLRALQPPA